MLIVSIPEICGAEWRYILSVVLGEFCGLEFRVQTHAGEDLRLQCAGERGGLRIDTSFFSRASECWGDERSCPRLPVRRWKIDERWLRDAGASEDLPALFGDAVSGGGWWEEEADGFRIGVDLFGGAFFLLSRYEEWVSEARDRHGRFQFLESIAAKCGLTYRPLVNEYVAVLRCFIRRLWPGVKLADREFRMLPSHDIDHPSSYWSRRTVAALRSSVRTLLRGQPVEAAAQTVEWVRYPKAGWSHDSADTLDWLMDLSEKHSTSSAFYYIPEKTAEGYDLGMPLDHPQVIDRWTRIADREHEIGVHHGYNSFNQPEVLRRGAQKIRSQLDALGIEQPVLGGRQHYLRCEMPTTANSWNNAGLDYDSTLGFAQQIGFRCGTCYEYPLYDVVERRPLDVRERPLLLMDCTLMDRQYMGLGTGARAYDHAVDLKSQCRRHSGDFSILWHNTRAVARNERALYASILAA